MTDNVRYTVADKLRLDTNGRQAAAGKVPRLQVGDTWETSGRQTSKRQVGYKWEASGRHVGEQWETTERQIDDKWETSEDKWQASGRQVGDKWKTSGRQVGDAWETSGTQAGDKWETRFQGSKGPGTLLRPDRQGGKNRDTTPLLLEIETQQLSAVGN